MIQINKINNIGIRQMSKCELKETNGGILPLIVGLCVIAFTLGYADGRRDKHAEEGE